MVTDHVVLNGNPYNYLTVHEGDLVDVLEEEGLNSYVVRIPAESSDEEEEGYVPTCCLEPLHQPPDSRLLNRNNNNSLSPPCLPHSPTPPRDDLCLYDDSDEDEVVTNVSTVASSRSTLLNEWSKFCERTQQFEEFPNCHTENELLQAKMEVLIKYHMEQSTNLEQPNKVITDEWEENEAESHIR